MGPQKNSMSFYSFFVAPYIIKTILDDIIKTKNDMMIYGATKKQYELLQFYFPQFRKKRLAAKIKSRVITEKSKISLDIHKLDKKELREMRFFPSALKEFPTINIIYANKVAMLSLEGDIMGVLIENKSIVTTQKYIFKILWKLAKK